MKLNKAFIAAAVVLLLILLFVFLNNKGSKPAVVTVNCNHESLSTVVKNAKAGTRIKVLGECREDTPVVITQHNMVIVGEGQTITGNGSASVIEVRGAKNVIISGLTLTGGKHGIFIDKNSSVVLGDLHATNNAGSGIAIGSDVPFKFPGTGVKGPTSAPDVKQNMDEVKQSPVTQMLNKWDFSFIKSAVADDGVCSTFGRVIEDLFTSENILLTIGDTAFVCGTVTVTTNGVGVSVLQVSTLIIYDILTMVDNSIAGMVVAIISTVDVKGNATVSESDNLFGIVVFEDDGSGIDIDDGGIFPPITPM
ncbi:MAG: hypothetical protein COB33_009310 [Thiotrichaceae bacterium]|nr:hypothetical protein [Thiotrichaceae bacterium]